MKDICIPIPDFKGDEEAYISVKVGDKEVIYTINAICWEATTSSTPNLWNIEKQISTLKQEIDNREDDWELIQILTPLKNAKYIRVLFRKRQ